MTCITKKKISFCLTKLGTMFQSASPNGNKRNCNASPSQNTISLYGVPNEICAPMPHQLEYSFLNTLDRKNIFDLHHPNNFVYLVWH